jgi:hypothetical protein
MKKMRNIFTSRIAFQGYTGEGLVQIPHLAAELLNYFHGHRGIPLDEESVLLPVYGNEGYIGYGLGGFNVAVAGHGGNYPEKIPRGQNIPTLFFYDLHFLAYPDLALPDDIEVIGVLLALNDDIGVLFKINQRQL